MPLPRARRSSFFSSFNILKALVRQVFFDLQLALQAPPTILTQVEGFLTMETASRKSFTLFLSHLATFFGLAFTMSYVQKDWERTCRIFSVQLCRDAVVLYVMDCIYHSKLQRYAFVTSAAPIGANVCKHGPYPPMRLCRRTSATRLISKSRWWRMLASPSRDAANP